MNDAFDNALSEAFQKLLALGELPLRLTYSMQCPMGLQDVTPVPGNAGRTISQVIAGKSQLSRAKEFRSFATMNVAWLCVTKTLFVSASSLTQNSMPRIGTLLTFKPYAGHNMQSLICGHSIEVLLQVATEI